MEREALYWSTEEDRVRCRLCPHRCLIADGKAGICTVRENQGGRLVPLTYGRISSIHLDPIEKKPLYHFHPGTVILSIGSWGCNLKCDFCQNWEISSGEVPTRQVSAEELVRTASPEGRRDRNIGIAYTYNEPLIWYEYVLDASRLAHEHGLKNVLVTNGEVEEEPLRELLPHVDALNVDIKAMSSDFYRHLCGGKDAPPRRTVELAFGSCHVEVTNLLVPGENDAPEQVEALVDWLAGISDRVPVHFSRYHPAHRRTTPPTPMESLERAWRIARAKLKYVYVGNAHLPGATDTHCPACGEVIVRRGGFWGAEPRLKDGTCAACGAEVDVVT